MLPKYHQSLDTLHLGCEEPRAYFVPFACESSALSRTRGESIYFKSLCGEWKFKYYRSFNDVEDIINIDPEDDSLEKLTVPNAGRPNWAEDMMFQIIRISTILSPLTRLLYQMKIPAGCI